MLAPVLLLKERISVIRKLEPLRRSLEIWALTMERVPSEQDHIQLSLQVVKRTCWRGFLLLEKLLIWMRQARVHPRLTTELGNIVHVVLVLGV